MTERFWKHIEILDGFVTEDGVERLVTTLAAAGESEVAAFEETLKQMRGMLNGAEFARAADQLPDDGTGMPFSHDALENLQYAVIAAGRERFEDVVQDPVNVKGSWDLDWAEDLATAATYAMDRLPEPDPDTAQAATAEGSVAAALPEGHKWVDLCAGIHICDDHATSYALRAAGLWDRVEAIAKDEAVAVAQRSGRMPRVEVGLQYFGDPAMAEEHSMALSRKCGLRRYRDRWDVRAWRDASHFDATNSAQIDGEVQDLVDAVIATLLGGLTKR